MSGNALLAFLAVLPIAVGCSRSDDAGPWPPAPTDSAQPQDAAPLPGVADVQGEGCAPAPYDSPDDLGRLFVATVNGSELTLAEIDALSRHRPAGVLIRDHNVTDRAQLQELIGAVHGNGETLALVDHEGGTVQLPTVQPPLGSARTQGQGTPESTRAAAALVGADLRALGFDVNLAPVADVENAASGEIGSRAFGADPVHVAQHSAAFAQGLQDAGIIPAFKHFPGYGRAADDAHLALSSVWTGIDELSGIDLPPFVEAIEAGIPLIMTSHLHYAAFDEQVRPATTSGAVIDDLLRRDLGFRGVVITDSLGMGAVTRITGSEGGAAEALVAGADLLLTTHNVAQLPRFIERIELGILSGEIPLERVNEALGRAAALQRLAAGGDASCLMPLPEDAAGGS